ncbi:hypothetical protein [Sinorhizobium medicae]|uniref:Uncharacterized protein n=1 Tax=Sinorhizobium medicae TaxID=110321 RepID=A0ABX4TJN1_9HYPH|nr:hypothetical protein [Sinorhizobium medicae]PLU01560.1 hypothetical protein BMJ33_18280 [Sinorhizobium medicae]PLU76399.1 hypothetical protein BMJ19_29360 [Sinorhizobium medicae]
MKAQLEAARQAAGEAISVFYDPRQNAEHATDLQRSHRLRGEMASLMQRAEAGAGQHRPPTATEPEEWVSFERRADAFFGA